MLTITKWSSLPKKANLIWSKTIWVWIQVSMSNLTQSFFKLDRFRALENLQTLIKQSNLQNRVSKLT
jgi:hypothetical protein